MAKKARRKHMSEKAAVLKSKKIEKPNKFEFNFNKEKYQILGRRKQKGESGRPAVSRAKAVEERKKTLGNEIRNFGKTNKFVDRRVGERDLGASKEDNMIKRFALERRKRYGKNLYNLDDAEENLTHYGQSLSEIEKYDDKPMSDEEEPNLNAEANFGGDSINDDDENRMSRKNFIDEMIARSKKLKHEKKAQKEQALDLTDKLDEQWKSILGQNLMSQFLLHSNETVVQQPEKSDYDVLVKELLFEKEKLKATDRLKSEEEIAKEEKDKLDKLEQQRLFRMNGGDQKLDEYLNPDDLETNLLLDRRGNRLDRKPISYNIDGKIVQENDASDESSDEDIDDDDIQLNLHLDEEEDDEVEIQPKIASDEKQKELPFVYEMPKSYSQLRSLLFDRPVDEQSTILDRLIKCLHPSLKEGNKQRLQKLFLFVLRYFDDVCESFTGDFSSLLNLLDKLSSSLFKLASYGGEYASKCVKALLKKHRSDFATKFKRKHFPGVNVFAFLRLIPNLFPASDLWHPVVTPSLLFASELLTKCKIKTTEDVGRGLLLCSIIVDYVSESKRLVPELIAYLRSVFFSAVDVETFERPSLATFGLGKPTKNLLLTSNEQKIVPISFNSLFSKIADKIKLSVSSCLFCATKLCRALLSLWSDCPSLIELFEPIEKLIERLPSTENDLCKELSGFRSDFASKRNSKRKFLQFPPKPDKEFNFFEPRIEMNFNPEKKNHKKVKGKTPDEQRLTRKYKREYKSTVRELKRDNEFIARQQFDERLQLDRDRGEKTKRLMSSLMGQEADYKKLKRMKKD